MKSKSSNLKSKEDKKSVLVHPSSNDGQNSIIVVWCLKISDEDKNFINNTISKFPKISNTETFSSSQEFDVYLKNLDPSKKIILVVSGTYAKELENAIKSNNSILSVFIYCFKPELYKDWSKALPKIKLISKNYPEVELQLITNMENILTECIQSQLKI